MKNWKGLHLFILVIISPIISAATYTNKLWSLATLNGNYGKYVYYIEPQIRVDVDTNVPFKQALVNAGGGWAYTSNWQFWLGGTSSTISPDAISTDTDEYRIWQQIIWKKSFRRWDIISRTRTEERISASFNQWAFRARERVFLNVPFASNLSWVIGDEVLVNLNRVVWIDTKTFDQNRAYFGIEQSLSKSTSLYIMYMNHYVSTKVAQADSVLVVNLQVNLET